ncbi:hypothetical protein [Rhodoglobus sp.]
MLLGAAPASAAEANGLSSDELAQVEQNIENADVVISDDDRESILAKLAAGGTLDSTSPNAVPVSVDESEADGWKVTKYSFSDGSYSLSSEEVPTEISGSDPNARSITGCTNSQSGSKYIRTNCTVKFSDAISMVKFRLSYYFVGGGGGGYGHITSISGKSYDAIGYNAGSGYVNILTQTGSPATLEAGLSYTTAVGGGTAVGFGYVGSGGFSQTAWPY